MKSFTVKSAPGSMLKAGLKTIAMGLGHPKARSIAQEFKPVQEALKVAQTQSNEADDGLILADADCELAAAMLIEDVDALQYVLQGIVKKDWEDPLYRAFFPHGLTEFKQQSPAQLAGAMPGFIQTLKDSGEDALRKFVSTFEAHVVAFRKPLEAFGKAEVKAGSAQLALDRAKVAWLDGYASLEAGFNKEFPRQKKFVARFFPIAGGPRKKDEDADEVEDDDRSDAPRPATPASPTVVAAPAPGPVASGGPVATGGPAADAAPVPATPAGPPAEKPRA